MKKLLAANRSEIAIRIFRAASELGLRTVALYSKEDITALHRFKADEAYLIGANKKPIDAYLSIDETIDIALEAGVDAIHPGYGFLSENPNFAEACEAAKIIFVGPSAASMRALGDKVSARAIAERLKIPVLPASQELSPNLQEIQQKTQEETQQETQEETLGIAEKLGYPLMIKASWGGGGRGMRVVKQASELLSLIEQARREAKVAFGRDEIYLERFVVKARHLEIQILGDGQGGAIHLFERDCSIQRRNQKIVERAPAPYLSDAQREQATSSAIALAKATDYRGAGTVEFLLDVERDSLYFIEVNPRIQVEHTITEGITGIDIVKAQLALAQGATVAQVLPKQEDIVCNGHALQCRITTEDPRNNFVPDSGRITAYRSATGFGIRLDGGNAYAGALISADYDPLLEKITAWAPSLEESVQRMGRALREFRIRGLATNLAFLENVLKHPKFTNFEYTTRFIDETPELFKEIRRKDRGTRVLTYLADVTVNGYPDLRESNREPNFDTITPPFAPQALPRESLQTPPDGCKQRLDKLGAKGFAEWLKAQSEPLICDTTMRDAHQSLLATRLRSYDILRAAESYAHRLPQLLSLECWGGATFDVAMRFLSEDPWQRLAKLRELVPNILLQMLLRGANAVGYKNYPDNAVQFFIKQAADTGIDLFRIFDCLNWVENMRVAIDAAGATGKIVEGAICYSGNLFDNSRRYNLDYYVTLARELEKTGVHILAIKDMAGLLRPASARVLVAALKDSVKMPIHLHTHDTSGLGAATILAAVEAGVDAFDAAIDSLSGTTSQPCLGSLVAALGDRVVGDRVVGDRVVGDRATVKQAGAEEKKQADPEQASNSLDLAAIRDISLYWEQVRQCYRAFESEQRAGASEVYLHEMPGGQFSNLKEQAFALGLGDKWLDIARAYQQANSKLGDIVKVTPSSKVVGDIALLVVARGLNIEQAFAQDSGFVFPDSLVDMLRGGIGWPQGGFPKEITERVLGKKNKAEKNNGETLRPGERASAKLAPYDLEEKRAEAEAALGQVLDGRHLNDRQLASYIMYPEVFLNFMRTREQFGPVETLPTPAYFYGLQAGRAISVQIERGKTLEILCQAVGLADKKGRVNVFFELNGQTRVIAIDDRTIAKDHAKRKAQPGNPYHIGSPMRGAIAKVLVKLGAKVVADSDLLAIEAMKIESIVKADSKLNASCRVAEILVAENDAVDTGDLLLVIESHA